MGLGAGRRKTRRSLKAGEGVAKRPPGEERSNLSKEEVTKTLVKRGYAREGDLLATVEHAQFGREGKNVLGEQLPAKKVHVPRLVAGRNVTVEGGTRYLMRTNGLVEVFEGAKGTLFIQAKSFRNGTCSVNIADDEMTATLTLTPSLGGGEAVTTHLVLEECSRLGITFGIDRQAAEEAVQRAQKGGEVMGGVIVARGEPPINGNEGSIELHVLQASGSTGRVRGDGSVDFKTLDRVTSVKRDQLIAVLTHPSPGRQDGHTVKGRVVKAQSGKPAVCEVGSNVRSEERGETVHYFSNINGKLVFDGKKISVEPVLIIEGDVGPKTGHIKFSGMVHVKGNVQDTYNVFSKKDITVEGNVGNCVIKTDGNLTVRNGIVGKNRGLIQVGGDVRFKFAENSNIRAGGSIQVMRAALNCTLIAGSRIVAVEEKGQIIGGQLKAGDGIEVKILGNESEHRMEVHVGSDFSVEEKIQTLQEKMKKFERALKKIMLVLDKLKKASPDPEGLPEDLRTLYGETRKKATIAKIAVTELRKKQRTLSDSLDELRDAEVLVRDTLYRGVKIIFGRHSFEPETRETKVKITYCHAKDRVEVNRLL
jgi:uncharacterized protein (DUF342 family)